MKITKIEKQKNRNRYSIFINDKFAFGMEEIDVIKYKLKIDTVLTKTMHDKICKHVILEEAKNKALKYLSYKSRTKSEVILKLKLDYNRNIIDDVVIFLEKYNYLDDYKYALIFIKDRVKLKHFGHIRLKHELKRKGVDDYTIEKALQESEIDEETNIMYLIEKKAKGNKNLEAKEKRRIFDFLIRKGFSYNMINECFNEYMN